MIWVSTNRAFQMDRIDWKHLFWYIRNKEFRIFVKMSDINFETGFWKISKIQSSFNKINELDWYANWIQMNVTICTMMNCLICNWDYSWNIALNQTVAWNNIPENGNVWLDSFDLTFGSHPLCDQNFAIFLHSTLIYWDINWN